MVVIVLAGRLIGWLLVAFLFARSLARLVCCLVLSLLLKPINHKPIDTKARFVWKARKSMEHVVFVKAACLVSVTGGSINTQMYPVEPER